MQVKIPSVIHAVLILKLTTQ